MFTKTLPASQTTTVTVPCPTLRAPSDTVFELIPLGGSTISATPSIRMAEMYPGNAVGTSYPCAYRNQATLADVAAGTAITAAGIYRIASDGLDLVLSVTVGPGQGCTLRAVQLGQL